MKKEISNAEQVVWERMWTFWWKFELKSVLLNFSWKTGHFESRSITNSNVITQNFVSKNYSKVKKITSKIKITYTSALVEISKALFHNTQNA